LTGWQQNAARSRPCFLPACSYQLNTVRNRAQPARQVDARVAAPHRVSGLQTDGIAASKMELDDRKRFAADQSKNFPGSICVYVYSVPCWVANRRLRPSATQSSEVQLKSVISSSFLLRLEIPRVIFIHNSVTFAKNIPVNLTIPCVQTQTFVHSFECIPS
jgi:hypothetical protein